MAAQGLLGEEHNLLPSECRLSAEKPFPRKCRLETLESWSGHIQYTCYWYRVHYQNMIPNNCIEVPKIIAFDACYMVDFWRFEIFL